MALKTTKLTNLVNPEVLADMIAAELPLAIRFTGVAPLDYTLVGQPGDTVTVPAFEYIGDAEDVAEGDPIPYELLTSKVKPFTVKKAGKGVKLTDESVLSGYGDPVGEGKRQIVMSIAAKIDNDTLDAVQATTVKTSAAAFDEALIEAIENKFNDENEETGVVFMNNLDAIALRKGAMANWERRGDLADNVLVTGAFGGLLGWAIVRTNKIEAGEAIAVKAGAAKTYLKRDLLAEAGRDMDHKITKFNADQHYVVGLYDESKALKVYVGTDIIAAITAVEDFEDVKSAAKKTAATTAVNKLEAGPRKTALLARIEAVVVE